MTLFSGKPVDGTVDTVKYSFHEFGDKYVLVIKNVEFTDSGTYKCSNILTVTVCKALTKGSGHLD